MYSCFQIELWYIYFIILVGRTLLFSLVLTYLLVSGFKSSVFVFYQACSLLYRDVPIGVSTKVSVVLL